MLFKISLKNIRKSFKDYTVYFFTLILGVAVFYVFNAIGSQTVMLNITSSMYDIIKLMTNILSGVSVFVSFILGFLIIYASRFLIRRRNQEFGIYMTLGMSKRKISIILFFETMLIGIISLVFGLILGTVLSQFMSVIVANMFDADMTKFSFVFSSKACIKTLIYFAIMYLLVMIFNTFNISRCRLIDLLNAGKKTEKVTMKNPILCSCVFMAGVSILSYAYWMVTKGLFKMNTMDKIGIPIALGCLATFLIFWSLSGLLIRIFTSLRSVYYRGVNSFVLRQFCSKINTTVFSITVICIMLFITISVLSGALSMKDSLQAGLDECAPVDVQLGKWDYNYLKESYGETDGDLSDVDPDDVERVRAILEDSKCNIRTTLENNGFDVDKYLKDIVEYNIYSAGISSEDSLGKSAEQVKEMYPTMILSGDESIMKISDYNKIAKLYGNETFSLNEDEYMIIADYKTMADIRNMALKAGQTIDINGSTYKPKYIECKEGFVGIAAQHVNDGIIVVPDKAVNEEQLYSVGMSADYKAMDKKERYDIENKLNEALKGVYNNTSFLVANTRIDIAQSSVGLGALVTFIALYLGIIFLISSAAILALKELSDSADNKVRYEMLRRIGVDERMIDMALFKQIGIFFAFPLILALVHAIFGLKFINILLNTMGMSSMMASVWTTAVFLIVIYGGYFLITYLCSKNIIRPHR